MFHLFDSIKNLFKTYAKTNFSCFPYFNWYAKSMQFIFKGCVYYMFALLGDYLNSMQTLFKCYLVCCSFLNLTISNLFQSYVKAICFICSFYLKVVLSLYIIQELWKSLCQDYVNCILNICLCYLETMFFLLHTYFEKLHSFCIGSK